jgi:NADPH:quinone reductase-like Zn-dependent oxidoreductase
MKAIVQDRYGPPEVLRFDEIDQPVPSKNKVLVRVHAAAVNPADVFVTAGTPYVMRLGFGLRRPRSRVRGMDLAGTVTATGPGVTRFRPGDEVFGEGDGSLAEFTLAGTDKLAVKPANLTFTQAAAVPMAALTALHAIRDHGKVRPGHAVLINGAAGGIGTFAVQIATSLGAEVTGVCSTRNVELVRSLGAAHVVDYTREDLNDGKRYDVILDNVGNHPLADLRRLLTRDGTLLPNSGTPGGRWFGPLGRIARATVTSPFVRHQLRVFVSTANHADLT